MRYQENAVAANELLTQAFERDSNGAIIFPEDYAGAYIDGENLVLLLTNTDSKTVEKYRTWTDEYAIGNITFPDDFAGARIEEDKLVLSLTDTTAENKAKYIRWAGDYADYLLFENVEYSYNQLMNAAIDVTNTLKESGYQITQYYVSEINNEVVLGMDLNSELCQNGVSQINRPEALAASLSKEWIDIS